MIYITTSFFLFLGTCFKRSSNALRSTTDVLFEFFSSILETTSYTFYRSVWRECAAAVKCVSNLSHGEPCTGSGVIQTGADTAFIEVFMSGTNARLNG